MPEHINRRITKLEEKVSHLERNTPRQQDNTSDSPHKAAEKENYSTPRQATTIQQEPAAPPNTGKSQQPWYKTTNGWKVALEIIAIPFAIAYAVVTYFQWRDLRHHFEIEQRAWIEVAMKYPTVLAENMIIDKFPITITNSGKSPALRVAEDNFIEIVDRDKAPTLDFKILHSRMFVSMLFPGKSDDEGGAYWKGDIHQTVPAEAIRSLLRGETYLVEFSQVAYRDAFGLHWTRLCGWHAYTSGDYQASVCTNWNSVGDGEPPTISH